jgi:hypothetical protein
MEVPNEIHSIKKKQRKKKGRILERKRKLCLIVLYGQIGDDLALTLFYKERRRNSLIGAI